MRGLVNCGATVAAVVLVAGCGGGTEQSGPTSSSAKPATSSTTPPPAIVAPAQLKPGKYPTTPHPPYATATTPDVGARVEAQQLAGYVVGPWAVDSTLTEPYLATYYVIDQPNVLAQFGPQGIADAAGKHNLIDGFGSVRQSTAKAVLFNTVLRFPEPADATAAATDMNAAEMQLNIRGAAPKTVAVPGHPDALASVYDIDARGVKLTTVRSFTAHGPYVFMQLAQSPDGPDPAIALVDKTIRAQIDAIEPFKPAMPPTAAQIDPTGLLALTLLVDSATTAQNAVYSGTGALHFQSNPISSTRVFQDNGVTGYVRGKTSVYQAKDPASAVNVANAFGKEVSVDGTKAADPVPALPLSRCILLANPQQFYCTAPAGNYVVEARGADVNDVHEQVAAQYILLTAKS
ncbi:hypothetical protein FZI85_21630 [Mycobacterium sp. CBMA293]|uniref:DUF7373 family lipoprotein n=1 Tax=unclassified Mycolicibacterium TaxID=2636767 RepID=UPI0012DE6728|nr:MULTISPECIES: hypothetical protein [unclassified Mycolicibacterium]MUL47289.1 hypothetical protein [Mycolicibacterium sp. CBMA 360]MUL61400.1 hypothetical protein [Mycolicibacterium sp. CBMA 335]MUL72135.1 hypothetical protein [Mycolicibacterium sp. CBMA 311]MUL96302.1 hypothetical protein [Mycolicibacterium sp. CBMA 230]MUM08875.1 hypothetical protein [Mycolicibacterium sp. CBMA 213]